MDFKKLEAFVQVLDCKSFSKAANNMFISQPSISNYINSLERQVNKKLIFRSTKEIIPTHAGEVFYDYAKNLLNLKDKALYAIQGLDERTYGTVTIYSSSVPSQYILPEILPKFYLLYPKIFLKIIQSDSRDVIDKISVQDGEIGIVGARFNNPKVLFEEFKSDKLILISPNSENYKNYGEETIHEIVSKENFILREEGSGTRQIYEKYFNENNIKIQQMHTSACFNNTQSIIHSVSKGLGLSIVSYYAAKDYIDEGWILEIKLKEKLPSRNYYIVKKKDFTQSAATQLFFEFLKDRKI